MLLFIVNVWRSLRRGAPAGAEPVGRRHARVGDASPPPPCNFDAIPVVARPRSAVGAGRRSRRTCAGLAVDSREVLVTSVLDAEPDTRESFPAPTIWPFVGALATTVLFIGSIFTPWAVVWGAVPVGIALTRGSGRAGARTAPTSRWSSAP